MSHQRLSSSPLSSLISSQNTFRAASTAPNSTYREAQPLPFELLQHVQVYFEEQLFNQAFRFLFSLLNASLTSVKPVLIPPPDYLAAVSTCCLHPSLTTRTTSRDKWANANSALKYLRMINKTVGPVNSQINQAYQFRKYTDKTDINLRQDNDDDSMVENRLSIAYADTDSVFSLAEDFWALLGWAMNCSCLPGPYAARWNYYCPYFEYTLDVLEKDWNLREAAEDQNLSLLWQYIKSSIGGNARGRRILRAIFADGSTNSLNEFREIFRKELKSPKSDKHEVKKREVAVDVDEEIYGDWMQEDESTSEEEADAMDDIRLSSLHDRQSKRIRTRTPSTRRRVTPRASKKSLLVKILDHEDSDTSMSDVGMTQSTLGGPESITIRLRLMSLLINVSTWTARPKFHDDVAFPDLQELYTLFVEFIRLLPLKVFQMFIMPNALAPRSAGLTMTSDTLVTLCEFILQRLIDRGEHKYGKFQPMTQGRLAAEYLPFAAFRNTPEAQANVSLLLESIVRELAKGGPEYLQRTSDLTDALQKGIEARTAKAEEATEGRKKLDTKQGDLAKLILTESTARMKLTIDALVSMPTSCDATEAG